MSRKESKGKQHSSHHRDKGHEHIDREAFAALKEQYGFTCLACGRAEPEIVLTIDHVVPVSLGGSNKISNLQPLCESCNNRKGDTVVDYRPQGDVL